MFGKSEVRFIGEMLKSIESGDEVYPRYLNGARTTQELFPELHSVTSLLSSAEYSELENFIREKAEENKTPINVFGLSISSQLIGIWGVVLLLSIQIYFCIHYNALLNQARTNEDVVFPWIALYHDISSKLVFQVSLFLPVFVCGIMFYSQGAGAFNHKVIFLVLALLIFIWSERIYLKHLAANNQQ